MYLNCVKNDHFDIQNETFSRLFWSFQKLARYEKDPYLDLKRMKDPDPNRTEKQDPDPKALSDTQHYFSQKNRLFSSWFKLWFKNLSSFRGTVFYRSKLVSQVPQPVPVLIKFRQFLKNNAKSSARYLLYLMWMESRPFWCGSRSGFHFPIQLS